MRSSARSADGFPRCGSHAKALLPRLEELRNRYNAFKRGDDAAKHLKTVDDAIAKITASTTTPTLVSIAEFRSRSTSQK